MKTLNFKLLFNVVCILLVVSFVSPATAATSKKKSRKAEETSSAILKILPKKGRYRYFVEFRSRPNGLTSHSYLAYGRLYSRGRIRQVKLAGLHPKNGSAGLLIGSFVGMDAQIAPVADDKNIPHTLAFRVPVTAKQYRQVVSFIKKEKAKEHVWNLVLNNCNGFISRVATIINVQSPDVTAIPPSSYVQGMIDLNMEAGT